MHGGAVKSVFKSLAKATYLALMRRLDRGWIPLQNAFWDRYAGWFPTRFERRIELSIDRGIAYFAAIDVWEIDSLFVLRQFVDASFDSRLRMSDAALERYWQLWRNPFLRLFDDNYDVKISNQSAPNVYVPPREMHQLMMDCVNADRLGLDEHFLPKLLAMGDEGGYGTTHILLGCVFLRRFSTITKQRLDAIIDSTIPIILNAQKYSRVSDIYSERVAMLQWLGLHQSVRPAWIMRIARGQMRDGGWYWERPPMRTSSYQHPTCLAVAALLQYRESTYSTKDRKL